MTGYSPIAYLPIWLPPTDDFYTRHAEDLTLTMNSDTEASIRVFAGVLPPDEDQLLTLYTPNGGTLSFMDDASQYGWAGLPAIIFQLSPFDTDFMKKNLPVGIPVPGKWVFLGLDLTSFYVDLNTWIQALSATYKQKVKDKHPPDADHASLSLDEYFYSLVLDGTVGCDLKPGEKIARLKTNNDGSYSFALHILDINDAEMNPAPILAAMGAVNEQLEGHPLLAQAAAVPVQMEVYLQFRFWDIHHTSTSKAKGDWSYLADMVVEVVDADILIDDVLANDTTDAEGKVSFLLDPAIFDGNDFYFRIAVTSDITIQYSRNGTWTGSWNTRNWKAVDGSPGYYEDFSGYSIGRPGSPLVFNIGTPVFLQLRFYDNNLHKQRPVAKGTQVLFKSLQVIDQGPGHDPLKVYSDLDTFFADENGEVWGTAFLLRAGLQNQLDHCLAIEDPSIELPPAWFANATPDDLLYDYIISGWSSYMDPGNGFIEEYFSEPAIGDPAKLRPIMVDGKFNLQAAALFILKVIRDTHQWFYLLSDKQWKGVDGLLIYVNNIWPIGSSVTPPNLGILYDIDHIWERTVIAHEYAHAVTWEYIPYSSVLGYEPSGLLWKYLYGSYIAHHAWWIKTDGLTAFMDGWSLFIQLALDLVLPWNNLVDSTTKVINLYDTSGNKIPLDSAPLLGLESEGCYSQAFWDYLSQDCGLLRTPDTDSADLTTVNATLTDPTVKARFKNAIWLPMTSLKDNSLWADPNEVTVNDFVNQAFSIMPTSEYNQLRSHLLTWCLV